MKTQKLHLTQIALEDEDYETLDNAVALIQDILDQMGEERYDRCILGNHSTTLKEKDLDIMISDLHALYEGKIILE